MRIALYAFAFVFGTAHYAAGLTFNISYDDASFEGYFSLLPMKLAVNDVAQEFSNLFSDPITINIQVAASTHPGNGSSSSEVFEPPPPNGYYVYDDIRQALLHDAKTFTDGTVLAGDVQQNDGFDDEFLIGRAEEKALGLRPGNDPGLDGTFLVDTSSVFTFNPNNRQVPGAYDFIGEAEHEFSEIMGRSTLLTLPNPNGEPFVPYDLLRFRGTGWQYQAPPKDYPTYLSFDLGATNLMDFNSGNGGDIQDWKGTNGDSFDAINQIGVAHPMGSLDLMVMDAIGYDPVSPTGVFGDYNHDGKVDAADYTVWRAFFGATYTQVDYNFWKANFGNHAGSGAEGTAGVPEPATLLMLLVAAAGMSTQRRWCTWRVSKLINA